MKDEKLYAVMIGEERWHTRYVSYCPFIRSNKSPDEMPLAIYLNYKRAQEARRLVLQECGHKAVHILAYKLVMRKKK